MRKNKLFFLCLFFCSTALWANSEPLHYHYKTALSCASKDFQFQLEQDIDFECIFTSISPIDQFPEKVTLYFKGIYATLTYQDQKVTLNTDLDEKNNIEFQLLKQLLHQPIEIELNRNLTIKNYSDNFKRIEQNPIAQNNFIHLDLLKQIIAMVYTPLEPNLTALTVPIPFITSNTIVVHPTFSEQKGMTTLVAEQPFNCESRIGSHLKPLLLQGHLELECFWNPKKFYTQKYTLKQQATEDLSHPLFEQPISLNSLFILTLHDK